MLLGVRPTRMHNIIASAKHPGPVQTERVGKRDNNKSMLSSLKWRRSLELQALFLYISERRMSSDDIYLIEYLHPTDYEYYNIKWAYLRFIKISCRWSNWLNRLDSCRRCPCCVPACFFWLWKKSMNVLKIPIPAIRGWWVVSWKFSVCTLLS